MKFLEYLILFQVLIIQAVYSQCVNRIVQGPNGPIELLPNQVLVPSGVPYLPPGQQRPVFIPGPNPPCQAPQPVVLPAPAPIPTEYTPNLPPGISNIAPISNIFPGNVIVPNIPPAISNVLPGNIFVPNIPSGNLIVPNAPITENYAPIIMHDNSVANSLANALQLLVVSSLLGNTLPEPCTPPCYDGYVPGYSYIY